MLQVEGLTKNFGGLAAVNAVDADHRARRIGRADRAKRSR